MILSIPTDSSLEFFEQATQLDGREYLLRFLWLDRPECWKLGIYDQDGVPLAVGIRLAVNFPLLLGHEDERLPPGLLMVVDQSGAGIEIEDQSDLGLRCVLTYFDADEVDGI